MVTLEPAYVDVLKSSFYIYDTYLDNINYDSSIFGSLDDSYYFGDIFFSFFYNILLFLVVSYGFFFFFSIDYPLYSSIN